MGALKWFRTKTAGHRPSG